MYRRRHGRRKRGPHGRSAHQWTARARLRELRLLSWQPQPGSYLTAADLGVHSWP